MLTQLIFNLLFVAAVACIIKPSLFAPFVSGKTLPRWVFVLALFIWAGVTVVMEEQRRTALKQPAAPMAAPTPAPVKPELLGPNGVPMAAPAAVDVAEPAAEF